MTIVKRTALGKNLSALLGNVALKADLLSLPMQTLPSNLLQPGKYQPRRKFTPESLDELSQSIKQQGLLQPLLVREVDGGKYEILAGERRWRACQKANVKDIPVIIKAVTDEEALAIALVENLQREDLTVLEAAKAIEQLMKVHLFTHQQVADLLGKSRSNISNLIRLLNLAPSVQNYLDTNQLEMGHARALLVLEPPLQIEAAEIVIANKLTVRATESLVIRLKKGGTAFSRERFKSSIAEKLESMLIEQLKTKVEIKSNKTGKGKLVIHYDSDLRLEEIVASLKSKVY